MPGEEDPLIGYQVTLHETRVTLRPPDGAIGATMHGSIPSYASGVVTSYNAEKERYEVALDGGRGAVSIKKKTLQASSPELEPRSSKGGKKRSGAPPGAPQGEVQPGLSSVGPADRTAGGPGRSRSPRALKPLYEEKGRESGEALRSKRSIVGKLRKMPHGLPAKSGSLVGARYYPGQGRIQPTSPLPDLRPKSPPKAAQLPKPSEAPEAPEAPEAVGPVFGSLMAAGVKDGAGVDGGGLMAEDGDVGEEPGGAPSTTDPAPAVPTSEETEKAAKTALSLRAKVEQLWAETQTSGQIDRLACWDIILADDELASLLSAVVGSPGMDKGKRMLAALKDMIGLDVNSDGQIVKSEFDRLCDGSILAAAELRAYVEQLWVDMGGPEKIERLACWDLLLSDDELACLLCRDDMMKGKAILAVMKSVRALDIDGDGHIVKSEFNRLFDPSVIAAAELRLKVELLWSQIGSSGRIERLECWNSLLADDELAFLIGKSDVAKGKAILSTMKEVKALDINLDGWIVKSEFNRLFDPQVIAAAELQVKVGQLWAQLGGSGRVERFVSWDHLLADDELAKLIGNADLRTGKAMLAAMREMRALGVHGDGKIAKSDFYGLFDPNAINEAKLRLKVTQMWETIGGSGEVEGVKCFDFILGDLELADIIGKGDGAKGKAMLETMKAAWALDKSGGGVIGAEEFQRIFSPSNLLAAEKAFGEPSLAPSSGVSNLGPTSETLQPPSVVPDPSKFLAADEAVRAEAVTLGAVLKPPPPIITNFLSEASADERNLPVSTDLNAGEDNQKVLESRVFQSVSKNELSTAQVQFEENKQANYSEDTEVGEAEKRRAKARLKSEQRARIKMEKAMREAEKAQVEIDAAQKAGDEKRANARAKREERARVKAAADERMRKKKENEERANEEQGQPSRGIPKPPEWETWDHVQQRTWLRSRSLEASTTMTTILAASKFKKMARRSRSGNNS